MGFNTILDVAVWRKFQRPYEDSNTDRPVRTLTALTACSNTEATGILCNWVKQKKWVTFEVFMAVNVTVEVLGVMTPMTHHRFVGFCCLHLHG